jgi:tetratricopeptide (TPR) repeat protein
MVALAYVGRTADALAEASSLQALGKELPASILFEALAGTVHRLAGHPAEARQAYRRALEHIPDDPIRSFNRMRVLAELGLVEIDLGLLPEAEASLTEALALSATEQRADSPLRADAWVGLARTLVGQHRPAEAAALLERADAFWRDFDPENPWGADAATWLGDCYRQLGREADARRALTRASRLRASEFPALR